MICPIELECPKPGCPNWDECHKLHSELHNTKWLPYQYKSEPRCLTVDLDTDTDEQYLVTELESGWAEAERLPYQIFPGDNSLRVSYDGYEKWGWAVALVLPYRWDIEREYLEVWCDEKIEFGFAKAKQLIMAPYDYDIEERVLRVNRNCMFYEGFEMSWDLPYFYDSENRALTVNGNSAFDAEGFWQAEKLPYHYDLETNTLTVCWDRNSKAGFWQAVEIPHLNHK